MVHREQNRNEGCLPLKHWCGTRLKYFGLTLKCYCGDHHFRPSLPQQAIATKQSYTAATACIWDTYYNKPARCMLWVPAPVVCCNHTQSLEPFKRETILVCACVCMFSLAYVYIYIWYTNPVYSYRYCRHLLTYKISCIIHARLKMFVWRESPCSCTNVARRQNVWTSWPGTCVKILYDNSYMWPGRTVLVHRNIAC